LLKFKKMQALVKYFETLVQTAFNIYFKQESNFGSLMDIPFPENEIPELVSRLDMSWGERTVFLLALMPHIAPEILDLFFIRNANLDKPYTEFGGWKGTSHDGFLPTGQTAAFLLTLGDTNKVSDVVKLFSKEHSFYKMNILKLESQGTGEPFLSGRLIVSQETLAKIVGTDPETDFPAKQIQTGLNWDDVILPDYVSEEISIISDWLQHGQSIQSNPELNKIIKPGYRALFYGPPGTGKTLSACLLAKSTGRDIYRVDLSMVVSKYIGETEKTLAMIFDRAENKNHILFFEEADALFGRRTDIESANDRHANLEIAYLLQRIEDFRGVILVSGLKAAFDENFISQLDSVVYFPIPDKQLRFKLWKNMIPATWLDETGNNLLNQASEYELSGGTIANVLRYCTLKLLKTDQTLLTRTILLEGITRELNKTK
jgi:AAA+ superfamily predicted ATPase